MPENKIVEPYPEYFNDVFGPIMQPGSSSHTAGPCRLGLIARSLVPGRLRDITIILDKEGSFSGTFGLMREDLGMLAGAYGLHPDDERMFRIREILDHEEISHEFVFGHIAESDHPNAVIFRLTGENAVRAELVGISTGGGMVRTVQVDGCPFVWIGDSPVLLAFTHSDTRHLAAVVEGLDGVLESGQSKNPLTDQNLVWAKLDRLPSQQTINQLRESIDDVIVKTLPAILPVPTTRDKKPQLFDSLTTWRRIAKQQSKTLYETAVDYEIAASGWPRQQVIDHMRMIAGLMDAQTHAVYQNEGNLLEDPFSGFHFRSWQSYERSGHPASGETLQLALHHVFGVQAFVEGVPIVPGPMCTGGGFLYSTLKAAQITQHLTDDDLLRGLFVAAGIGAICYTRSEPTGEVIGCTGECGFNAAMIAAGLTEMRGGTPAQVENAASLVLQACIGWPCDPIPGGDNQPCLSRFVTAVSSAITFSDLALSGRESLLPFHEVVDQADIIGRNLPKGLRCTSIGGLCAAPTALKRKREFSAWRKTQLKKTEQQA